MLETKLYRLGKLEIADILKDLAELPRPGRGDSVAVGRRAGAVEGRPQGAEGDRRGPTATSGGPSFWKARCRRWSIREEDYIIDEDAWVIVTRDGWIKRQKSFADVPSIRVRDDDTVGLGLSVQGQAIAHAVHRSRRGPTPSAPMTFR